MLSFNFWRKGIHFDQSLPSLAYPGSLTFYAAGLKNTAYSFDNLRQLSDTDLASIVYASEVSVSLPENARKQELDARMAYFLGELKRTGVTRLLLWEEYRKESSDPFGYTQFCILLKQASKITNASMHVVHTPAAMVMVDFAGDKMSYVDRSTGCRCKFRKKA